MRSAAAARLARGFSVIRREIELAAAPVPGSDPGEFLSMAMRNLAIDSRDGLTGCRGLAP